MSNEDTAEYTSSTGIASAAYQAFIEFPYSALTIPRFAEVPKQGDEMKMPKQTEGNEYGGNQISGPVSDELSKLLTSPESVSYLLAQDPLMSPGQAWKKLYGDYDKRSSSPRPNPEAGGSLASDEALKRAAQCGHWGPTQPTELFLRVSLESKK